MKNEKQLELVDLQRQACKALEAGAKLAARSAARRKGLELPSKPNAASLGLLLANPAAFWAGATVCESFGDGDAVEPLTLATQYAAARLAAGDLSFARETLIGQSVWLGVLTVKLAQQADADQKVDKSLALLKLALKSQQQAAAAIATAAALNKFEGADSITVE
jgi:hypothetical protein